jgi:hypothetical protein
MEKKPVKKIYASPELITHGDVEKVTLGGVTGAHLDASFPAHTPKGDLTFS